MQKVIGRESEIEKLQQALNTEKPELIALYGRRRVGKTFLVRQVYKNPKKYIRNLIDYFEV